MNSNSPLQIISFNCHGIRNFKNSITSFLQFDIIYLCETWVTGETIDAPTGYKCHCAPATKPARGRPAGGTALLIRSSIPVTILTISGQLSVARIGCTPSFTFIGTYWTPTCPIEAQLPRLCESIEHSSDELVIVMGDLNCRVGTISDCIPIEIPFNPMLTRSRSTRDSVKSRRGAELAKALLDDGMIIINGRTRSDPQGNFSFISPIGHSVVDLVISSLSMSSHVLDGGVLDLPNSSDHLPTFASLLFNTSQEPPTATQPKEVFRINPALMVHYNAFLANLLCQNTIQDPDHFVHLIIHCARDLKLNNIVKPKRPLTRDPWYDSTCFYFYTCLKRALRDLRRRDSSVGDIDNYLFLKRNYNLVLQSSKKEYYLDIANTLSASKNPKDFWDCIKRLSHAPAKASNLQVGIIHNHFSTLFNQFPPCNLDALDLPAFTNPVSPFTLAELDLILRRCKTNKAAGSDGIPYEFYTHLNIHNRLKLLASLNKVLESETIPESWGDLSMFLIHKKGSNDNIENYRGISLVNCITKIFTSLLANRLYTWAEEADILPESQSGFRPGRSCADNVFIVQCAIYEQCRTRGNWMFCAFVDFKQAFDRVNHKILWQKLASMGLSPKYIRILAAIYNSARVRVAHKQDHTEPINIHNGVLQGDCLSPLLFNLLLVGLELLLESRGLDGVGMGHRWSINCLFYADDLVLFARSRKQLQDMLNCLAEFCSANCMSVNPSKTKVVVFSTKKTPPIRNFLIDGEPVEVVSEFCYLGITFASNCRFDAQLSLTKRKAVLATASIANILMNCKKVTLECHMKIHRSKALSAIHYCAELWAINHLDAFDQLQNQHFKRLFFLHNSTPGYAIRAFFECPDQQTQLVSKALRWYNRVASMSPIRWPNKCLSLLSLRIDSAAGSEMNWLHQLRSIVRGAGVDLCADPVTGHLPIPAIAEAFSARRRSTDHGRILNSSHCPHLAVDPITATSFPAHLDLNELRLAYPILLRNILFQSLYWRGRSLRMNPSAVCPRCGTGKDTIEHLILHCMVLNEERKLCGLPSRAVDLSALLLTNKEALLNCVLFVKHTWSRVSKVSPHS